MPLDRSEKPDLHLGASLQRIGRFLQRAGRFGSVSTAPRQCDGAFRRIRVWGAKQRCNVYSRTMPFAFSLRLSWLLGRRDLLYLLIGESILA